MDWCPSAKYELSALDSINEQTQNLERAVLRENEIKKNLQGLLQKMVGEIKAAEEQANTYRENIKATLNRQRMVENSIQSTNESCLLVEKLRCDLKKQVTLEQMRTEEQRERLQNIVNKYEKLWKSFETVYNLFPMVPKKNDLQLNIKKLEIIISQKRKILEDEEAKKHQIETIRERIMQLKIVQFVKLVLGQHTLHEKYSTMKEKIWKIEAEVNKKKKVITEIESKVSCEREKTVSLKQALPMQAIGLPNVTSVPAIQLPSVTPAVNEKMKTKVPETPKARELTKVLLFSPLEMTHIELPQLKLPVFNSPPRKVQRMSRPVVRPVRLFPEYSFQEKEPSTEDTRLVCPGNETIPMEVNRDKNELEVTVPEEHMEVEATRDTEQVTNMLNKTPEQLQSLHQPGGQQQNQQTKQQTEQEQSQLMHQHAQEQRQEELSLVQQDQQTSQHIQQQLQQQQPQQCLWQQQDENDQQQHQNETETENLADMQTDEEPVVEMRSSSQPLSDTSDICELHPLNHDESDDSTSERARREFLSKVTKSPEFTFIPRRDINLEEVDRNDEMQIVSSSQYFLNPLQSCSEERTAAEQARQTATKRQDVTPQALEAEFVESSEGLNEPQEHFGQEISSRVTDRETNITESSDYLALSFRSLSPPGAPLSPPSSEAPVHTGNQGFMFNFAPQSSSNIMSLFGEGEQNQDQEENSEQQKKNEAFTFTFDKKTKSSSFFKLF